MFVPLVLNRVLSAGLSVVRRMYCAAAGMLERTRTAQESRIGSRARMEASLRPTGRSGTTTSREIERSKDESGGATSRGHDGRRPAIDDTPGSGAKSIRRAEGTGSAIRLLSRPIRAHYA